MNKIFGVFLISLLFPIIILVGLVIFLDDGFPILFRQKRVGRHNINFWIIKFRTMKVSTPDIPTHLATKDLIKYTNVGKLLRKYSIDELPQLFNIIKGEMKFIGPRPALHNQYDLIELRNNEGIQKLDPGVTGWAQINGRDTLSISEKVKMDKYYLDNESFILNIKILLLTVKKVFKSDGVSI